MSRHILRSLLSAVPVAILVSAGVFSMLHLVPGDPVLLAFSGMQVVQQEQIDAVRHRLGLDRPLYMQYLRFVSRLIRLDFGESILTGRPVLTLIVEALPSTLVLALSGVALAVLLGTAIGIAAAIQPGSRTDRFLMGVAVAGISIPDFLVGSLLLLTFALRLGWVPVIASRGLSGLILPALTLAIGFGGVVARLVRAAVADVMGEDFIRTARSKGLSESRIMLRHALPSAAIPVIAVVGVLFGRSLAGIVVIETLFARQGLGGLLVGAILSRDFPLAQATVLVNAGVYLLANLLVDVLNAAIDPRIRYS